MGPARASSRILACGALAAAGLFLGPTFLAAPSSSSKPTRRGELSSARETVGGSELDLASAPVLPNSLGPLPACALLGALVLATARAARQPRRQWRRRHQPVARSATATASAAPPAASAERCAEDVDIAVVGGGPAGSLLSYLLAERYSLNVCLIDARAQEPWPNNYGVWVAEWEALEQKLGVGLDKCLDAKWAVTDCYFGGSWDRPDADLLRLDRPYGRVDRTRLRERVRSPKVKIIEETLNAEAVSSNIYAGLGLRHDAEGTTITLASGSSFRAKIVVDATGSESRLTRRYSPPGESPAPDPGYQIAYGFECIVDGHTHYAPEAMTLFDYRTDHLRSDPVWEDRAMQQPTFMYAMPLGRVEGEEGAQRIFFEETSLVARPGISFEECKKRAFARLKHLGVSVRPGSICDEEFCYIPMGGPLPEPRQRTVAFGGAAATVHPATGYQLCRMMASAVGLSQVIGEGLKAGIPADAVSAAAYDAVWSPENQAQRDFAVFGGEFLMGLDAPGLRGWFDGFFRLPEELWAGFLAGWPGLPGNIHHESWWARLIFGLQLVVKIPLPIAARLAAGIVQYTLTYGTSLIRSVTPLLGLPPSYAYSPPTPGAAIGDMAAKEEAWAMMKAGPPREAR